MICTVESYNCYFIRRRHFAVYQLIETYEVNTSRSCWKSVPAFNETLSFCSEPKYLRVTLDRSLTYRRYLEPLRKKLTSLVALLRRLARSSWGAGTTPLLIATLALVHSTAEYCAPAWCRRAHNRLIDHAINDALRIVTGCTASYTSGQPSNPRRHSTCWASSQWSQTVSRTLCHGPWTSAPLKAHLSVEFKCTSYRDTHLYPPDDNS